MRLPRVYLPGGGLEPEQVHYLVRVLRLKPGSRFLAFDGSGSEWLTEVIATAPELEVQRLEERRPAVEPTLGVTLYLGLTKGERFDSAVERATELGITRLVPLECARSAVRSPGASRRRRWETIAVSAACQSGRVAVPQLSSPCPFAAALEEVSGRPAVLFAPGQPALQATPRDSLAILIGPEGGFAPEEVDSAAAAGVTLAGLGARVLRVETATAAALTLVYRLAGEF